MRFEVAQSHDEPEPVECGTAAADNSGVPSPGAAEPGPDVAGKIITALDRLARARRMHRQEVATARGLSILQADLMWVLAGGLPGEASVGNLVREMDVTQPTVTDSLHALECRGLVEYRQSSRDRRKHIWNLTEAGAGIVADVGRGDQAGRDALARVDEAQQETTLTSLLHIVASFVSSGTIDTVRTCLTCRFHRYNADGGHHCSLLDSDLQQAELRVDCPEHIPAATGTRHHPDSDVVHGG